MILGHGTLDDDVDYGQEVNKGKSKDLDSSFLKC